MQIPENQGAFDGTMTSTVQDPAQAPAPHSIDTADAAALKPAPKAKAREKRPNYALIHSRPLPVEMYPLPAFIPHNPLSIVRIAVAMLSHSLWPPSSHVIIHKAYFSRETQSIHVTDAQSIRALWEQGFWGSGSLSRSEPRWLDLEKRKRGLQATQTSEEVTQQRRRERRQFKLERARLEREAIEEQRRAEGKSVEDYTGLPLATEDVSPGDIDGSAELLDLEDGVLSPTAAVVGSEAANVTTKSSLAVDSLTEDLIAPIKDQEHLQLTFEESFFLVYALGALDIYKDEVSLPAVNLLRLFCAYSCFPLADNRDPSYPDICVQSGADRSPTTNIPGAPISADNSFLLKYIVFHHFRSLGWVVRPGIKFAVDYLLYNRGPAFSHAEFAVMILPSYTHPYWSATAQRKEKCKKKETRDWWWLHRVNRVQSLAHKTLMLVYVDIPPPWDQADAGSKLDVGAILKRYKVREFVLGRWTPNRHR
jgi:tRNA-splicing endonuclease subunit Sen2